MPVLHRPVFSTAADAPPLGRPFFWLLCLMFAVRVAFAALPAQPAVSSDVCTRVQIFYYNWYGAPPYQSGYVHWPQGGHLPPDDIGSNFYPLLGPYSSSDAKILKQHMEWIRSAHVGVLALSWWGRGSKEDRDTRRVLDAAAEAGLKIDFDIEPYPGRTPPGVADDIAYILRTYGRHRAFYFADFLGGRPLFYIFNTARNSVREWKTLTEHVHREPEPVIVIAQTSNLQFISEGGFDGGYTYDGLAPFTIPGFLERWSDTVRRFAAAGKLFIPSVGAGYWDDRAVPQHSANEPEAARTRDYGSGKTYERAWEAAIRADSPMITVTSFNEWQEGTQIEPAIEHRAGSYVYPPYAGGPFDYLARTTAQVRRYPPCAKSSPQSRKK